MADEQNLQDSQSQELSQQQTDEQLRASQEEQQSQQQEEQRQEEQRQLSPEELQAERTRLGRKVADQERILQEQSKSLGEMKNSLEQVSSIIQTFAQMMSTAPPQKPLTGEETGLPDYIPTDGKGFVSFLDQVLTSREQGRMTQAQRDQQQYGQGYRATIQNLSSGLDSALASEIRNLTTGDNQPHNLKHSNDPIADAKLNFANARLTVLEKQLAGTKRENPLKGGDPLNPLGAGPSQTVKTETKTVKMTDASRRAAEAFKMTPKQLKELGLE